MIVGSTPQKVPTPPKPVASTGVAASAPAAAAPKALEPPARLRVVGGVDAREDMAHVDDRAVGEHDVRMVVGLGEGPVVGHRDAGVGQLLLVGRIDGLRGDLAHPPDAEDAIETAYDRGWTDGLPVVPPIEEFVDEFLDGRHHRQAVRPA